MAVTVEQQNEINAAVNASRARDTARIFREVFGPREKRTKHGEIILEVLGKLCPKVMPPNIKGEDAHTDIPSTFRKLGHYDVLALINEMIDWKESEHGDGNRSDG